MTDYFYTAEKMSEGFYSSKGSRFYSFLYPVRDTESIRYILEDIKKRHHSAHHYVYAWVLGDDSGKYRAYDDGEPSNSSGMPVLGQIRANSLTDVVIVVVRYFGGTKLGIPGLVKAYKTAAREAINNAVIVRKVIESIFRIDFDYAEQGFVNSIFNDFDPDIKDRRFTDRCRIIFGVKRSEAKIIEDMISRNHRIAISRLDKL